MFRVVIAIVMSMTLAACGGGGGGGGGGGEVRHTVGGSISGLTANGLVLANGTDTRSVDAGATSFTLPTSVAAGSSFNVIVQTQPIGQTCSVAGGSGTVGSTNVTSVAVTCITNTFSLGGSINGLTADGLVLANGGDTLPVEAGATRFTFDAPVAQGGDFNVTVQTQPAGLTCSVDGGSDTMGTANVTSVTITCVTSFTLGGSISGLTASGLVLANGEDTLTVDADARVFTFPTALTAGSSFAITVNTQPAGLICSVANGSGVVGNANVNDAVVTCSTSAFILGGSISGLMAGGGLVLANGGVTLAVDAGATRFTFPELVAQGGGFNVTVQTQPAGLICSVANGGGVMGNANVNNAVVTCSASAFTLGGSIGGLTASGLVLANGGETLAVDAGASSFTFPALVAQGGGFDVTVQTQPSGQTCAVGSAGTMGAANVTSVTVICGKSTFTVGGAISGLTRSGLVLANGGETLVVAANAGGFTLLTPVDFGSGFNVTVQSQPSGLTCSVFNGIGTMGAANVTNVAVTCSANAFALSGSISGLASSELVLANGGDTVTVIANDSGFTLPRPVASGSRFNVTVQAQPSGLTCSVFNGIGTMGAANVTNVAVTCSANAFTLGGSISGLASGRLVLANGSDTLSVTANANRFSMPAAVAVGSPFEVTVQTQADEQTCSVSNGSDTMGSAEVSSVSVTCVPATFTVETFAGSGQNGSAEGIGAAASFRSPQSVAVDSLGNVYVADINNHKIRKITPAGVVSTFAGSGAQGNAEGSATTASFNNPQGVAVDSSGTVYVADALNHKIRKITAAGVVSTLAGSGQNGSVDGSAATASFSQPFGVAVDSSGTVYVADAGNRKIRKITAGEVSTLAGSGADGSVDGAATEASFNLILDIAVDRLGNVYVAHVDQVNDAAHKIRRVTAGVVSTFAGSGAPGSAEGSAATASFDNPSGVAVDSSGTVYVADGGNSKIRKITAAEVVSTLAGSRATDVAVDGNGTIYVADSFGNKILKITRD